MDTASPTQIASFIGKMIRPFPLAISIMFLVAIIWALDLSLRPYILKIILNRLVASPTQNLLYLVGPILVYFLMTVVIVTMFRLYTYYVDTKMIPKLRQKITDLTFKTLLDHNYTYYQDNFSGGLASKVNDLVHGIPDIIQIVIDRFFSHSLALIIALYTLWRVNMLFALGMLVWIIIYGCASSFYAGTLLELSDQWSGLRATVTGKIVDALSNILSIKLFAQQHYENQSLNYASQKAAEAEQALHRTYARLWLIYAYSFVGVQGLYLYTLIAGWQNGTVSVGDFALVLTINALIVDSLWSVAKDFSQFSKQLGKVKQALRTINRPVELQDKATAVALVVSQGMITFNNVWFHHPGMKFLFEHQCITIFPGQKIGLVGYSGGGKSTFINLILRLFEINDGAILIDGQNIQDVTQESLRKAITMIPQDPLLFHRTIEENIQYGRLDATAEDIVEAAKQAYAHDFIMNLPNGYRSEVGERGIKLSGGQRQRIAIARAALKNAPILILDEATNQLDSVTESQIQESLKKLMAGKTTIIIAHRLSTLLSMDRILVFDKGKIIEDGAHQHLLVAGGLYKTLWDMQVNGFLCDEETPGA